MPLEVYVCALFEAVRWHHPSVDFLIRSRVDLVCAAKEDDVRTDRNDSRAQSHLALHELFSVACRYGSPVAPLLFEKFSPAINVNQKDIFDMTPLVAAILAVDYSRCKWLLRRKANASAIIHYVYAGFLTDAKLWARILGIKMTEDVA